MLFAVLMAQESYVCEYTVINHSSTVGCGFLWKYWRKTLAQSNPTNKTPNFPINWYGAQPISKWTKRYFSFCWIKRLNTQHKCLLKAYIHID